MGVPRLRGGGGPINREDLGIAFMGGGEVPFLGGLTEGFGIGGGDLGGSPIPFIWGGVSLTCA